MSQSQILSADRVKTKLQNYGIFMGYSALGMIGFAYFSYKLIITRKDNMQKYKKKSRIPVLHKQTKRLGIFGLMAAALYTFGMYQIVKRLPQSQTNIQMRDYSELSDENKKSPEMQDHYILQTMKLFGVSENLIQKTKKQFKQMGSDQKKQKSQSLNKQFLGALIERRRIQAKFNDSNNKNK